VRLGLQIHYSQNIRGKAEVTLLLTNLALKGEAMVSLPFSILSENRIHRDGKKCRKALSPCERERAPS